MVNAELEELVKHIEPEKMTAHEAIEVIAKMGDMAEGIDPAVFLLQQLSKALEYKEVADRWFEITCWLADDQIAGHMIDIEAGGKYSSTVFDFLKRYRAEHDAKLTASYNKWREELNESSRRRMETLRGYS